MQCIETFMTCRICYEDGDTVRVCDCTAPVHLSCLQQWNAVRPTPKNRCEICSSKYNHLVISPNTTHNVNDGDLAIFHLFNIIHLILRNVILAQPELHAYVIVMWGVTTLVLWSISILISFHMDKKHVSHAGVWLFLFLFFNLGYTARQTEYNELIFYLVVNLVDAFCISIQMGIILDQTRYESVVVVNPLNDQTPRPQEETHA